MGAWIEIKATTGISTQEQKVAPLVGAWIEISVECTVKKTVRVAPLVGAWIEISEVLGFRNDPQSLPLWERGLK